MRVTDPSDRAGGRSSAAPDLAAPDPGVPTTSPPISSPATSPTVEVPVSPPHVPLVRFERASPSSYSDPTGDLPTLGPFDPRNWGCECGTSSPLRATQRSLRRSRFAQRVGGYQPLHLPAPHGATRPSRGGTMVHSSTPGPRRRTLSIRLLTYQRIWLGAWGSGRGSGHSPCVRPVAAGRGGRPVRSGRGRGRRRDRRLARAPGARRRWAPCSHECGHPQRCHGRAGLGRHAGGAAHSPTRLARSSCSPLPRRPVPRVRCALVPGRHHGDREIRADLPADDPEPDELARIAGWTDANCAGGGGTVSLTWLRPLTSGTGNGWSGCATRISTARTPLPRGVRRLAGLPAAPGQRPGTVPARPWQRLTRCRRRRLSSSSSSRRSPRPGVISTHGAATR